MLLVTRPASAASTPVQRRDGARASSSTAAARAQAALRLQGGVQSVRRDLLAELPGHDAAARRGELDFDPERLYAIARDARASEGPDSGRLAPVRLLKGSRLLMRARRLEKCTTEEERQQWRLP